MSWTDIFPVLDDAMVLEFQATATGEEREELSNWFAVQRVENRRDVKHIVSLSLFWKNIRSDQPDIVGARSSNLPCSVAYIYCGGKNQSMQLRTIRAATGRGVADVCALYNCLEW